MSRSRSLRFILGFLPLFALSAEVHVSPAGLDGAAGGPEAPVQTIHRALVLARQNRGEAGYRVVVHGGTHYLPATVVLGEEDAGTAEAPTRIEAAPGASPRVVAGRLLDGGWEPHRGDILKLDLKPLGLEGLVFRELYCNGTRQILARYPNFSPDEPNTRGWLYAEAPAEPGSRRAFVAYEGDLKPWQDLGQAEIFQFHAHNYYNVILAVTGLDHETRTVNLAGNLYQGVRGNGAERYFFQNLLAELDEPGEWYLDRAESVLYFWPPAPIDQCRVEIPVFDFAFHLQPGAAHIVVEGLTVEIARRTAIHMQDARHCLAVRNTVRHCGIGTEIGGWATWEDCCGIGIFGGRENGAVGNDISFVGGHGIKLTGGDVPSLAPAGNFAENNYIHHTGMDWKQGLGARVAGVGNRFSRNTVHTIPRMGVLFHGWDIIVEQNHLYHLNLETCDTGAIYTGGRDGVSPWGSVVRHNYIHDVIGFGRTGGEWTSPHYSWGIYLDDFASGVEVYGNIVVGSVRGGVHIHSGRHNLIHNNILVGATQQQIEFNGWNESHRSWASRQDHIVRNWEERRQWPAWQKFERLFSQHPRDWGPDIMGGNRIFRNILVGTDPDAGIYRCNRLPLEQTEFDHNLLWLGGRPVTTGMVSPLVRNVGDTERAPNPAFAQPNAEGMPGQWRWYSQPSAEARVQVEPDGGPDGRPALAIHPTPPEPGKQFSHAMLMSDEIPVEPGKTYRLAVTVRADRPHFRLGLVAQSFAAGRYHWARDYPSTAGPEWRDIQFGFTTPGPETREAQAGMDNLYIRIDCRESEGTLWIADVSLREAEVADEWEAWREIGKDRHSVIAEPRFVDPANGDYRLQPDSPAHALGFQPIPTDRIGCYPDPRRATWPLPNR